MRYASDKNQQLIKKGNNSKLRQAKVKVHVHCTPLDEIYPPTTYHNHSLFSLRDMHRKKSKYKKKQRAITQKLSKQELQFIYSVLPLDKIYPPTKFHNHSKYSFRDMHQTKLWYESKQRAITQKISKQELWFMCTALPLDEIYPPTKFHNHS